MVLISESDLQTSSNETESDEIDQQIRTPIHIFLDDARNQQPLVFRDTKNYDNNDQHADFLDEQF